MTVETIQSMIDKAVAAERERCAKIALAYVSPKDGASKRDPTHRAKVSTSDGIASAIRQPVQSN